MKAFASLLGGYVTATVVMVIFCLFGKEKNPRVFFTEHWQVYVILGVVLAFVSFLISEGKNS